MFKILKNKFFIVFVLLLSAILIYTFFQWHSHQGERIIQSVTEFKGCMNVAGNKYKNETKEFFKEFKKCMKKYISIRERYFDKFGDNKNEKKQMFLPLKGKEEDCKWFTVGIDETLKVEMDFKEKYPLCSIFGADPYPPKEFSSIGTVFKYGVDLDNTFNTAVVSVNDTKGPKDIQVYSIPNLLINFIHSRIIYYLTIDIEGYEYKLLESLVGNERYANVGLTFCQISVNLHNPKMPSSHPAVKNLNMVEFILTFLQQSSPYLPIYNLPYTDDDGEFEHQKITFINLHSPLCEEAFKISRYF